MYSLIVALLRPYPLLCLLLTLALVNLWRRRLESRKRLLLITIPWIMLMVLSLPLLGYLALGSLEWQNPPLEQPPADAKAIVVLAGGVWPADSVRPQAELAPDTLVRCLRAAEIYHQGSPRPILISGGTVDPGSSTPPAAQLMETLLLELGVPASELVVEDRSRNTFENAVECRKWLDRQQIQRIVLVTEATHLPRAWRCFLKQGIDTVPAGCHYRATGFDLRPLSFWPSPNAVRNVQLASHEWLGLAWYWIQGRI